MYPVLATERFRLRPLIEGDCPRFAKLSDDGGIDTAVELQRPLVTPPAERWIASHALLWETLQALHWAVVPLAADALIGYVGLTDIDLEHRRAKLTFRVGPSRQCNDRAIEAAQAALAFAFTDLGLNRISACHRVRQPRAAQTLSCLGMRREGLLQQSLWDGEQFEDVMLWAILRIAWVELLHRRSARVGVIAQRSRHASRPHAVARHGTPP
jgi:[ribosomal protein S5]-alanine N-acetyltransferase